LSPGKESLTCPSFSAEKIAVFVLDLLSYCLDRISGVAQTCFSSHGLQKNLLNWVTRPHFLCYVAGSSHPPVQEVQSRRRKVLVWLFVLLNGYSLWAFFLVAACFTCTPNTRIMRLLHLASFPSHIFEAVKLNRQVRVLEQGSLTFCYKPKVMLTEVSFLCCSRRVGM
jgi:hypothetical protein